jgi:hypothetical protein
MSHTALNMGLKVLELSSLGKVIKAGDDGNEPDPHILYETLVQFLNGIDDNTVS